MKIVAGLGNPGRRYQGSRHNVGFDVLDEVARRHPHSARKSRFQAELVEVELALQKVLLLWPQTYMNLSGTSVGAACEYYQVAEGDLLVVCDEFQLPVGKIRFRPAGSSGGHKGLADILRRIGSEQVARLRVGVGPVPEAADPAEFVLARFGRDDGVEIEQSVARAADGVVDWVNQGIEFCMNRYNA
jgi:PTH1 family peptidyl-tRNA hydrolase